MSSGGNSEPSGGCGALRFEGDAISLRVSVAF
jgi:hypothetical protein